LIRDSEMAWNEDTPHTMVLRSVRRPEPPPRDWSAKILDSKATEAEVSIPLPSPGSSVPLLTISPRSVFRGLIEVTCMT
jgi:hypothetical protein